MTDFKLSVFTIIRNGLQFDYPFLESFASAAPLADEWVINVGAGDDATEQVVSTFLEHERKRGIPSQIIRSDWQWSDPAKRKGGQILAHETNRALDACTGDWCLYLQADEVIHERDLPHLRSAMKAYLNNDDVEGLVFPYIHFYGNYGTIQQSRSSYRREVRAFKRSSQARSVGDAQSFRGPDSRKLRVALVSTPIYHYGWVRHPVAMREKTAFMDTLYHADSTLSAPASGDNYQYRRFWGLKTFMGTHPQVMHARIASKNWDWNWKQAPWIWSWKSDLKKVLSDGIEKTTGWRPFEYRAYRRVATFDARETKRAAVVVTTYNDTRSLSLCLESLLRQRDAHFDIFVADDGSTAATQVLLDAYRFQFQQRGSLLTHVWHEDQGYRKSVINNKVFSRINRAVHSVVVCIDGDTWVHPLFVADHLRQHTDPGPTLFMGRRIDLGLQLSRQLRPRLLSPMSPNFLWKLWKSVSAGETRHLHRNMRLSPRWLRRLLGRDRVSDILGSNFSISTELLRDINGYNEEFQSYWGEDGDLFVRARNRGACLKGSKAVAVQFHIDHPRREPTPEHQERYFQLLKTSDYVRCAQGMNHAPPHKIEILGRSSFEDQIHF